MAPQPTGRVFRDDRQCTGVRGGLHVHLLRREPQVSQHVHVTSTSTQPSTAKLASLHPRSSTHVSATVIQLVRSPHSNVIYNEKLIPTQHWLVVNRIRTNYLHNFGQMILWIVSWTSTRILKNLSYIRRLLIDNYWTKAWMWTKSFKPLLFLRQGCHKSPMKASMLAGPLSSCPADTATRGKNALLIRSPRKWHSVAVHQHKLYRGWLLQRQMLITIVFRWPMYLSYFAFALSSHMYILGL